MRKLGFGIMALIGIVVILGVSSVATFSVNTTTRTFIAVREIQQADTDVVYELRGSTKGKDKSANSTVCPGVEATDGKLEKAWNDQIDGNWIYKIKIKESSANSWPAGRIYRAEFFGDGDLLTTLYFHQDVVDDTKIEGIEAQVDLGSDTRMPDAYITVTTRLSACP